MSVKALRTYWSDRVERCGFILTNGQVIEVENVANNPETEFEIAESVFNEYADEIKATWHTHTGTNANLSLEDYLTFLAFPEYQHWIVSAKKTVLFGIEENSVVIQGVYHHDND